MDKYPTISVSELTKLKTILDNASDPKYLDGRVCPYDKETREILKSMIVNPIISATVSSTPDRPQVGAPKKTPILPMDEVEKEFVDLRKEIQELKTDSKGLESHERIQIVKTRAALVEKIIGMKERINDMRRNTKFIATVMQILEDELPQESRLRIIEKLAPFAEDE